MLLWQIPTQSSNIIYETYNFQTSELVSDGKSIYFSNNRNEFYSIDTNSGAINWKNEINSNMSRRRSCAEDRQRRTSALRR